MKNKIENVDLNRDELRKTTINRLSLFDAKNEVESDSIFGWDVIRAQVEVEETQGYILSYQLYSVTNEVQARAERICTKDSCLEYWRYEYKGRNYPYSPDPFQPLLQDFIDYFYKQFEKAELIEKDLSMPIVSYEINDNKLNSIRYALVAEKIWQEPLLLLNFKDNYLASICDWQNKSIKSVVLPTPKYPNSYLLQDFSDSKKCSSNNLVAVENTHSERTITFQGFNNFNIKVYRNNETEDDFKKYGFFLNPLFKILTEEEIWIKYIPTINYHIIKECNMNCRHCFSDFEGQKHLSYQDAENIIKQISEIKSFKKLNFSGGEPTLFPKIQELAKKAKSLGIKELSLVTNGFILSKKTDQFSNILEHLDILAFSIDSFENTLNISIGRDCRKETLCIDDFIRLSELATNHNCKIKVNTVVTKLNYKETLIDNISRLNTIRWKILRMLPISGQNDKANEIIPSDQEFKYFIENNKTKAEKLGVKIIIEENDDMMGSYLMISPNGRFFNNTEGEHRYSASILDVGIKEALKQTPLFREIFYNRDGDYSSK